MKTTQSILDTLTGTQHFQALAKHRCYRKFLSLLPPRFQEAIGFVYVRNETLHVALRHPGYKMELNYNKELLTSLLATLVEHDSSCSDLQANSVILFNSKYATLPEQDADRESIPHYHELSDGAFEDNSSDPDLHEQFERLRATIRRNRQRGDVEHD